MSRKSRATRLALALAAFVPAAAQAAQPPCLTPGEFTSLAGYSLPSVITGTSQRCASVLGADAFLRTGSNELVSRYAQRRETDWPGAKAAFLKMSATMSGEANRLFRDMPDASLKPVLDGVIAGMVSQQIPLDRCRSIDRVLRLLSPLPAENTAELIALAVGLASKTGERKLGKITVCPT